MTLTDREKMIAITSIMMAVGRVPYDDWAAAGSLPGIPEAGDHMQVGQARQEASGGPDSVGFTHRSVCYVMLIRLCEMQRISLELGDLLNDPAIVKVDVDSLKDNRFLKSDYNQKAESTLDLWHLVDRCGESSPYEMAKLAEKKLGVKLDKYWRIRISNWENTQLSKRQIRCAASDAHMTVEMFRTFAKKAVPRSIFASQKPGSQRPSAAGMFLQPEVPRQIRGK
ncbi:exonuclease 3'-5' domain-containing protein 2-like [Aedes albopictus]|uniref:3'-5' exonuclease domain-containing protein n=1 Tax=Aedes albopictus TaxID=7160 RepID=A0ABM2A3E6_AEDAL